MIQLEHTLQAGEQLCFIHIPKTAGTTLISLLDAHFPVDRICPAQLWRELVWLPPDQVSACQLLRGHYTYDDYLKLASNPVFISMFRNPIDRACSYYNFMRNQPDDWLERHYSYRTALAESHPHVANLVEGDIEIYQRANRDDLASFFASSFVQTWIQNWQVKAIARSTFDQSPWDREAVLATAKERLTTLVWFGLVERFADSMALLSYTFGWNPIRQYQRLMVAPNPNYTEGLSAKTVEMLKEIHQLDLAFYDDAAAEFAQRYAAMQQDLQERYSGADLHDQLEQHYRDRTQALNLPRQTVIDLKFDQAIAGTGWQLREGSVEEQTLFRWTGPETETTLDLPLAAGQDFILKLRIVGAISEEVLDSVQLRVGDRSIPLTQLCREIRPGIYLVLLEGHIPAEAIQPDVPFTRLIFSVQATRSLQSFNPKNPDQRPIGVAFNRIHVFPHCTFSDRDYVAFLFPVQDKNWLEPAQFLQHWMHHGDRLFAPFEFVELFPQQTCSYTTPIAPEDLTWVVLHKDFFEQLPRDVLAAVAQWRLVFQNDIFRVYTCHDASEKSPPLLAQSTPFLFPSQDSYWQDAVNFLQLHLQEGDRLLAPREFVEVLPLYVVDYVASGDSDHALTWAIVHKGMMEKIPVSALSIVSTWQMVFHNPVFVIYTSQDGVKPQEPTENQPNILQKFPFQDEAWLQVANILQTQINAQDRLLAPSEFLTLFPSMTQGYASSTHLTSELTWAVIHKGLLHQLPVNFLQSVSQQWNPVFANEVFVIYRQQPHPTKLLQSMKAHVEAFLKQVEQYAKLQRKGTNFLRF